MAEISEADFAQLLVLDLFTLRAHTEQAGHRLDEQDHAEKMRATLVASEIAVVRRNERIVAYANLWRREGDLWFVGMFNTHPDFRNAGVMRALISAVKRIIVEEGVRMLQSNVYKTNALSLAFHRKLGFTVTRENDAGVEMTLQL